MQTVHCQLLPDRPPQPPPLGEVRVTVRRARSPPRQLARPGAALRKTLVALDVACLLAGPRALPHSASASRHTHEA
ncbi:UNVERIFIED_CONTAM: hypothetical protein K2H54_053299 [Gekko kuhli]